MFRKPILILLLLAACGYVDYDDAPVGRLKGSLFVMWVGEGGPSGDGKFVFVPDPNNRLTLIRTAPNATLREIRPTMMYTDGGSIPKIGQVFNGFSPWGYAPAYMMHDWLFVARQCLNDDMATPEEAKVAAMSFQEFRRGHCRGHQDAGRHRAGAGKRRRRPNDLEHRCGAVRAGALDRDGGVQGFARVGRGSRRGRGGDPGLVASCGCAGCSGPCPMGAKCRSSPRQWWAHSASDLGA